MWTPGRRRADGGTGSSTALPTSGPAVGATLFSTDLGLSLRVSLYMYLHAIHCFNNLLLFIVKSRRKRVALPSTASWFLSVSHTWYALSFPCSLGFKGYTTSLSSPCGSCAYSCASTWSGDTTSSTTASVWRAWSRVFAVHAPCAKVNTTAILLLYPLLLIYYLCIVISGSPCVRLPQSIRRRFWPPSEGLLHGVNEMKGHGLLNRNDSKSKSSDLNRYWYIL